MSKDVGDRLPAPIMEAFDGERLQEKVGPAFYLVTPDPDGTPRPCMLSSGEILAVDDRTLRVALWPDTRTSQNLSRGARALFCYAAPGAVFYVRGRSRAMGEAPPTRLERFEITVDSVESDLHGGMPVVDGLRFGLERGTPDEVARGWEKQIESLRAP